MRVEKTQKIEETWCPAILEEKLGCSSSFLYVKLSFFLSICFFDLFPMYFSNSHGHDSEQLSESDTSCKIIFGKLWIASLASCY